MWKMVNEKDSPRVHYSQAFSSHSCLDISVLYGCCWVREQTKMNRYRAILKEDASLPFSPAVTNLSNMFFLRPRLL